MREAAATTTVEQDTLKEARPAPPVNPIDMTGGKRDYTVAAGRFASPTGFVNYNLPMAAEPAAAVASGVREEKGKGEKKKKAGVVKRVAIGAAWVGGISYGLGGVGERLKRGGAAAGGAVQESGKGGKV